MTTDELLSVLTELGLQVILADGQPALRGKRENALPQLLRVLRLPVHRQEILRRLNEKRLREWRFATGWVSPAMHLEQPTPVGARWWRYQGDSTWQPLAAQALTQPITSSAGAVGDGAATCGGLGLWSSADDAPGSGG